MKKYIAIILTIILLIPTLVLCGCSCGSDTPLKEYKPIPGLNTARNVTLNIAIEKDVDLGLNKVANEFMKRYKNVTVNINYVENYINNTETMIKNNTIDIVFREDKKYDNETEKAEVENYYYNFAEDTEIDFSGTNSDIFNNFRHQITGTNKYYQYALPLGGNLRGLFVNTKLLSSLNLSIPTNYTEFLDCCSVIKENGLIPIQGNPSYASVNFGIANAVNDIIQSDSAYESLKNNTTNVSDLLENTFGKMYELATERYYDYKAVESTGFFKSTSKQACVDGFLGIKTSTTGSGDNIVVTTDLPDNNYGNVAFFPYISSLAPYIQNTIDKYSLDTTFQFIATPLNDENKASTYYLTPALGLCANKNSANLMWIREFVNFIFYEDYNILYAMNTGIVPNTKNAKDILSEQYATTQNNCLFCGKINFATYNAYNPIASSMVDLFKCSASKYMIKLEKNGTDIVYFNSNDNLGDYLFLSDNGQVKNYYISDLEKDGANLQIFNDDDDLGDYYKKIDNSVTPATTTKIYLSNLQQNTDGIIHYTNSTGEYIVSNTNIKIYKNYIGEEDPSNLGYAFCNLEYYIDNAESVFNEYR